MRPLFVYDLQSAFAAQIQTSESEANKVFEPVVALVTDNKDPQKLGRVKVKYPVLAADETSFWAPIIMLGAGKKRGWFFIPEKDDEVLVLFEQGELDRPMVVGAMWNGKDKPSDKNPGGNHRRVIKSRAGSKITLDDEKNTITIEDGKQVGKIVFESDSNKVTFEAIKGDVAIQSPTGDSTIIANEIEMKASNNVNIHSGQDMKVGAGGKVDMKASSVRIAGSKANANCGTANMPDKPTTTPQEVADPYNK